MSNRLARTLILALSLVGMAVIVAGCSSNKETYTPPARSGASPGGAPVNGRVQSSTAGNVTVDVKLVKAEGTTVIFDVTMDTHSVDLDKFNLGELAILRDGTGNEYRPVSWKAEAGGHHRSGTLTFRLSDSSSPAKSRYLEMVIRDVAVKERVLKWQL